MFLEDFLNLTVIKGFGLSHVLKPLSHDWTSWHDDVMVGHPCFNRPLLIAPNVTFKSRGLVLPIASWYQL